MVKLLIVKYFEMLIEEMYTKQRNSSKKVNKNNEE